LPAVTDFAADLAAPDAFVSTGTTASPPAGHAAAGGRGFTVSVSDIDGAFAGTFVTGTDFVPAGAAGTGHAGGAAAAGGTTSRAASTPAATAPASSRDRDGTHRRRRTADTDRADADMKPPPCTEPASRTSTNRKLRAGMIATQEVTSIKHAAPPRTGPGITPLRRLRPAKQSTSETAGNRPAVTDRTVRHGDLVSRKSLHNGRNAD
jgi:hypothetical protein